MPTAPTLVAFAEAENNVTSGTNVTTASVSWQSNDVVIVLAGTEGATGGETLVTPTTTGSGISFGTAQQIHNSTGSDAGVGCWAAVASANSSGTYSISATHGAGSRHKVIGVYIYRGSAGIGNSAISTGTSRTVSLTPTGADSGISWIVMDWNTDATVASTPTPTTHTSGSPGPTASRVATQVSPNYTFYIANLDDQTGSGAVGYGVGGSGVGPFSIIAIEAKAAAGGGTDGSVIAVVATASVAAVAPVVTGIRNATVNAVVATINSAAPAPAVSAGQNGSVTAVVATVSTAAVPPVVTGIRNATVSAVVATINSAAVAPVVAGEAVVSGGGPASITLAAIAPVVTGIRNASVTAVKATVSVQAYAPVVDGSGNANVTAVKATVSVAAVAPAVSAGASVTAVKATLSTAAVAPSVAVNAFIQAVAATLTVAAPAPVVFSPDARVNAVAAGILVTALAPHVGAQATIYIFTTPTIEIRHRFRMPEDGLMRRIGIPTGETLVKEEGFYTLTEGPVSDERIAAADAIYLGGHEYILSDQEVTDLTNAGYGDNIRQELQG